MRSTMSPPREERRTPPSLGRRSDGSTLRWYWLIIAIALALGAIAAGALTGSVYIDPVNAMSALLDRLPGVHLHSGLSPLDDGLFFEVRLPRALMAAAIGGLLALSGAAYQGVFRNPLVDPYLLGSAAGAGLGATLAIVYAPAGSIAGVALQPPAAFVGAVAGVALAYGIGTAAGTLGNTATLVLAGVAVASFLTAVQTFALQRHSDSLQEVYSWILGQLGTADWQHVATVLPYLVVTAVVVLLHGHLLDALAVGDEETTSLGLRPQRIRLVVLLAASLGTAAAVAASGLIGFVGLVVPHIIRRLTSSSYRVVLPLSLLGGAAFLVLADLIARTVLSPAELPIGVVTAFVGAPFFAGLLRRNRRAIV